MIGLMKYKGGKGKCYQRLINLMPPHRVYIEPYLGGGAVLRNKRPAEVSIGLDIDSEVIASWQQDFVGLCTLAQIDAVTYLSNYPYTGDELIYADPPYLPAVRRRAKVYRHDYVEDDHRRLLDILKNVGCKVMLSGYPNVLYDEVLTGWRKASFRAKTHVDVREECVWMNFDPPQCLHDGSHLGHTFRERQNVKRRHSRIVHRFGCMDPVERHELLGVLNATYGLSSEAA